ncbi:MAG: OB-fold domain-containing protein [Acidimicrobiia bacterium]|nr:OB-fold domain-containing protein [Acidimicrobiia bacterium]
MSDGILLPVVDEDGAPFWEGTRLGELRMQRCSECARFRFPPRPMCPWCRSTASEWPALSGRGIVWSFAVSHPPLLPAYAELAPYNTVVVALDEDPSLRLVGNLIAAAGAPINSVDPATIEIGEPIQVVFDRVSDDIVLPRWTRP